MSEPSLDFKLYLYPHLWWFLERVLETSGWSAQLTERRDSQDRPVGIIVQGQKVCGELTLQLFLQLERTESNDIYLKSFDVARVKGQAEFLVPSKFLLHYGKTDRLHGEFGDNWVVTKGVHLQAMFDCYDGLALATGLPVLFTPV